MTTTNVASPFRAMFLYAHAKKGRLLKTEAQAPAPWPREAPMRTGEAAVFDFQSGFGPEKGAPHKRLRLDEVE